MVYDSRILGLDFGQRRIGVAISDLLHLTAQPLATIDYQQEDELWRKLDELWSSYPIALIVVGLPRNMDGSEGVVVQTIMAFAEKLKKRFQAPVVFQDERLSSVAAHRTIREMGKRPSRHKNQVDKLAAILILQTYLDQQAGGLFTLG